MDLDRATVRIMSRGKGFSVPVNQYLRDRALEWLDANPDRTQKDLADEIGVTPAQINTLLKHGRGAGWLTVKGFAKLLRIKGGAEELEKIAESARPAVVDPYPARTAAFAPFAGSEDIDVREAIRRLSGEWKDAAGKSVEWWSRRLHREIDEIRLDRTEPGRAEARRTESEMHMDELEAAREKRREDARAKARAKK